MRNGAAAAVNVVFLFFIAFLVVNRRKFYAKNPAVILSSASRKMGDFREVISDSPFPRTVKRSETGIFKGFGPFCVGELCIGIS